MYYILCVVVLMDLHLSLILRYSLLQRYFLEHEIVKVSVLLCSVKIPDRSASKCREQFHCCFGPWLRWHKRVLPCSVNIFQIAQYLNAANSSIVVLFISIWVMKCKSTPEA